MTPDPKAHEDALSLKVLVLGVGASVALSVLLGWLTGYVSTMGEARVFFSTPDADEYRRLADYFATCGKSERPSQDAFALRPFLFPLYLALYHVLGVAFMQSLQILSNGLTLCFLYAGLVNLQMPRVVALGAVVILSAVPSFQFLAFHALSETLTMTLIAAAFYAATRGIVVSVATLMACAMLVKPALIPFSLASVIASIAVLWRQDRPAVWKTVACVVGLLLAQTVYSVCLAERVGLSSAASINLEQRFFPAVYGYAEKGQFVKYLSKTAKTAREKYPTLSDKLNYVVRHPVGTWNAFKRTFLDENLLAASRFVRTSHFTVNAWHAKLIKLSKHLNVAFAFLHASALILMPFFAFVAPRSRAKSIAIAAYLGAISVLLPTCLVYFQGDRAIVAAAPLWLAAYTIMLTTSSRWLVSTIKARTG